MIRLFWKYVKIYNFGKHLWSNADNTYTTSLTVEICKKNSKMSDPCKQMKHNYKIKNGS